MAGGIRADKVQICESFESMAFSDLSLSRRFFAQITPRNCLEFMFTPSLPNHAGCFHALKYVESRHHSFPLGGGGTRHLRVAKVILFPMVMKSYPILSF